MTPAPCIIPSHWVWEDLYLWCDVTLMLWATSYGKRDFIDVIKFPNQFLKRKIVLGGPDLVRWALLKQRFYSRLASEEDSKNLCQGVPVCGEELRVFHWPTASKTLGPQSYNLKEPNSTSNLSELGWGCRLCWQLGCSLVRPLEEDKAKPCSKLR